MGHELSGYRAHCRILARTLLVRLSVAPYLGGPLQDWQLGTGRPLELAGMAARALSELVAPDWSEALQPVEARIS